MSKLYGPVKGLGLKGEHASLRQELKHVTQLKGSKYPIIIIVHVLGKYMISRYLNPLGNSYLCCPWLSTISGRACLAGDRTDLKGVRATTAELAGEELLRFYRGILYIVGRYDTPGRISPTAPGPQTRKKSLILKIANLPSPNPINPKPPALNP